MSKGHHPFVGFSPPMPFGLRSTETWNAISWPAFMSGLNCKFYGIGFLLI
jgi:hypothetical protein